MSWRLILRLLWLVVAGGSIARARRGRRPGAARGQAPPRFSQRVAALRRDAGIAAKAVNLAVFLAACALLFTAGTSSTLLAPRWLGIILLTLGGAALVAAVLEVRSLRRAVVLRRLERRDEALRRGL